MPQVGDHLPDSINSVTLTVMEEVWLVLGVLRFLSRIALGGFFLFQGVNAFWGWVKIPEPSPKLAHFLSVLTSIPYLMTLIKVSQILCGLFLIIGHAVGLSLFVLGIQIYGIFQLQRLFNHNTPFAIKLALFYLVTLFLHFREFWDLITR
jgi:hypothetical protein